LPITFDAESIETLQPLWHEYQKELSFNKTAHQPPKLLQDLISAVNGWLKRNTQLCTSSIDSSDTFDKEV